MRTPSSVPAAALSLLLLFGHRAEALTVSSAEDLCAVDSDPCRVTSVVEVAGGSVLDFHRRAIEVTGDGQLHFAPGDTRLRCGALRTDTKNAALKAGAEPASGRFLAGTVTIEARRGCEAGPPELTCASDFDCHLASCGTRRCSSKPTRTCGADSDCQLGPCSSSGRCQGATTYLRCSTNADCDLGTCPAQLTCNRMGNVAKDCTVDADCELGSCNVGDASIELGGSIDGDASLAPKVVLDAVDSVTLHGPVRLSSLSPDGDGGGLDITTRSGDVNLEGRIVATGGRNSRGGAVKIRSGRDVAIGGRVNLNGGDFDGGDLDIGAGRDVAIRAGVTNSSVRGEGYGGFFFVTADGELRIGGNAGDAPLRIVSNGHSKGGFSGDGGIIDLYAEGDILIGSNVRLAGRGAGALSYGSDILLTSNADIHVDGDLETSTRGSRGEGGAVKLQAEGAIAVGADASLRSRGGMENGGFVQLYAQGPVLFAGEGEASGAGDLGESNVWISSGSDIDLAGRIRMSGDGESVLKVDACRVRVADGATLRNNSTGSIRMEARESMSLMPGSALHSPKGSNVLTYRTADKPPALDGHIDGPPELVVSNGLGCPVCGNGEVDQSEDCDDGNLDPGDGCDGSCHLE